MIKPNLDLSENRHTKSIQVYFDVASKQYGLRECIEVNHDGVHIGLEKSIDMSKEQLEKLNKQITDFLGIDQKYER